MIALLLLIGLLLYIVLAWSTVRMVGWLARFCAFTALTKRVLQVICAAFFVLLPTWDIIPSRLYFLHLCNADAGIKVFKTVEVDQSYFRPDGVPDDKKLLDQYVQSTKWNRDFSAWAHIAKIDGTIQDRETGELLGSSTDFSYYGGWVEARIAPMSPLTCPAYKARVFGMALQQVFKLKQPSLQGRN